MDKLKNKVILIADDAESNIFALTSFLEASCMKVIAVKDGQEVLLLLGEDIKPDIILLDMMMPVMDGYETLSALKQNDAFKNIPVIAITAKAMKGDKEKCITAGAWDYMSKPLDTQLLIDKLIHWIT